MEQVMSDDATVDEEIEIAPKAEAKTEVETPEVEDEGPIDLDAPEKEAEVTDSDEEQPDTEADDEDEPEPLDAIDFGGTKLEFAKGTVPAEIVAEIQERAKGFHADYTRKSQANAETAKALSARTEAITLLDSMTGDIQSKYSEGLQLTREIQHLSAQTPPTQEQMNALSQADPDQWRRVSDSWAGHRQMIADKTAQFQEAVAQVSQLETHQTQAQNEQRQGSVAAGKDTLERALPNFSTKHLPTVLDYAEKTLGMERSTAERDYAMNPGLTLAIHKAALYDAMQAKVQPKLGSKAAPVKAPRASGSAKGSVTLANANMEQYAKMRAKQGL
jgi:hypothetical protein